MSTHARLLYIAHLNLNSSRPRLLLSLVSKQIALTECYHCAHTLDSTLKVHEAEPVSAWLDVILVSPVLSPIHL